jgi:hypothetical protein
MASYGRGYTGIHGIHGPRTYGEMTRKMLPETRCHNLQGEVAHFFVLLSPANLLEQSSDDEIQNQQKNYGYEKN